MVFRMTVNYSAKKLLYFKCQSFQTSAPHFAISLSHLNYSMAMLGLFQSTKKHWKKLLKEISCCHFRSEVNFMMYFPVKVRHWIISNQQSYFCDGNDTDVSHELCCNFYIDLGYFCKADVLWKRQEKNDRHNWTKILTSGECARFLNWMPTGDLPVAFIP